MYKTIKFDNSVGRIESNTLIEGNCLDVMKAIPDNSVDMILCDPPYG
jgi:DNA modification methylase